MPVRIHNWSELTDAAREAVLARPAPGLDASLRAAVDDILQAVRTGGDAAVLELTQRFDGVSPAGLRVDDSDLREAERSLPASAVAAIRRAIGNVRRFHEAQRPVDYFLDTAPGVRCERVARPIDCVGMYVPAGTAPLPSAAIMLAVPAAIAGCSRRVLCTPPRRDGRGDAAVLTAARLGGVTEVYRIGGAQAIAAMAYGTETVPKVDKIFGPGNTWVTAAKSAVAADPAGAAIDMPAGPSEVLVIADAAANPGFVAADLLSQAEHDRDSQVVLVTTSSELAGRVAEQIDVQLEELPRREIASAAIANSRFIVVDDLPLAIGICNRYAPEHLILQIADARSVLPLVRNAGSVFLGPWSPESAGDYCSGTNHVLPTAGKARSYSGLSVEQFMRQMTVQELSLEGLRGISATILELARLEGLEAHAAAVTRRLRTADTPGAAVPEEPRAGIVPTMSECLARSEIRGIERYEAAVQQAGSVRLNANEAPRPLHGEPAARSLNRYPDIRPVRLHRRLAEHYRVAPGNLLATRGSSEAIDLLVRAFCRAGRDSIVILPPTFGMYRVYADLQGARTLPVPLSAENGFALDPDAVLAACTADTRIVFVCSPNNPTGNAVPLAAIRDLARARNGRSLVVVDEAYAEFCREPSAVTLLGDEENVVVLRTLSKALSLAGARCGAVLGSAGVIAVLDAVLAPYALATPVVDCVLDALAPANLQRAAAAVDAIVSERERMVRELGDCPQVLKVWPSQANFLLVRLQNPAAISAQLQQARILIRELPQEAGLRDCARVTVGLPEENDLLLSALASVDQQKD